MGKSGGGRPLGRRRRDDNIKMDLTEIGCGMDWIILVQCWDQ
jgi:hypothetical protein